MNDSLRSTTNSGSLGKQGGSPVGIAFCHESAMPERHDPSDRVFLSGKLAVPNFGAATRFHTVKNARAFFTSFSIHVSVSGRKTVWHASCFMQCDASSFRRSSAGQEIPARGRCSTFTEFWTAPMAGCLPHISNQPTIK
jgi:hypothetical protein